MGLCSSTLFDVTKFYRPISYDILTQQTFDDAYVLLTLPDDDCGSSSDVFMYL